MRIGKGPKKTPKNKYTVLGIISYNQHHHHRHHLWILFGLEIFKFVTNYELPSRRHRVTRCHMVSPPGHYVPKITIMSGWE